MGTMFLNEKKIPNFKNYNTYTCLRKKMLFFYAKNILFTYFTYKPNNGCKKIV